MLNAFIVQQVQCLLAGPFFPYPSLFNWPPFCRIVKKTEEASLRKIFI